MNKNTYESTLDLNSGSDTHEIQRASLRVCNLFTVIYVI